MATFTGTGADEEITPLEISGTVTTDGDPYPDGGVDIIYARGGDDFVQSGNGDDEVYLGRGDDTYRWGAPLSGEGGDTVRGGKGYDKAQFKGFGPTYNLSTEDGKLLVGHGIDTVTLTGIERVEIQGLEGNDTISVDDLSGSGLQLLVVDFDHPSEKGVSDGMVDTLKVDGSSGADDVVIKEVNGAVRVLGLSPDIRIRNPDGADDRLELKGGGGADHLDASLLPANVIRPILDGEGGNDLVEGSLGADFVYGGKGLDMLRGGKGADFLFGGTQFGSDNARDVIVTGGGADTVALALPSSSDKADIVTDFKPGFDFFAFWFPEIETSLIDATSVWGEEHFHVGRNAADADDFIIHRKSTGAVFFDGDGNGDGAKIKIAVVDKGLTLAWDDFGFPV